MVRVMARPALDPAHAAGFGPATVRVVTSPLGPLAVLAVAAVALAAAGSSTAAVAAAAVVAGVSLSGST